MNKIIFLITKNHPLLPLIETNKDSTFILSSADDLAPKKINALKPDLIIDLTLLETPQKHQLLLSLSTNIKLPVISDLTCHWGDGFLETYETLKGALSLAYLNLESTHFEYYLSDTTLEPVITLFASKINMKGIRTNQAGCGFQFPRTLAMLVNEAYFANEQGVATPEAIDQAMLFGVNYPKGLFKWSQEIGQKWIVQLLDELYQSTGDSRYRSAVSLRLSAIS